MPNGILTLFSGMGAKEPRARIGFVSTRLAGTDGVSLEAEKWANIITELGYECFFFAGESDWPEDHTHLVAEAHFQHPEILSLQEELFGGYTRSPQTSRRVEAMKWHLKEHLRRFVDEFQLDLLIAENALSLPVNVPLGLALTEFIAETKMPVIGHHHDFWWERKRFVGGAVDYLRGAFPPVLPSIHHVVINSFGGAQLALRTGASSVLIPNVMDFDVPPPGPDEHTAALRPTLGIGRDEYLLLQPTRIVPRKRIQLAIELLRRLELPGVLVISHSAGDEGTTYEEYLRGFARLMGVRVIFAQDQFGDRREGLPGGRRVFSLADAYHEADLVTYPSTVEGFGNAFLEAIYYRRPIVMSTYEIFETDIEPKGFRVIEFGDFIEDETVRLARAILLEPSAAAEMVAHNYEVARHHYSYGVLRDYLTALIHECLGR